MATNTQGTTARNFHKQLVHYLRKTVAFGSAAETLTLGIIPAGSIVIDAGVIVSTAFDSGTTDTLDIGTAADPNGFATLLDLQTVGRVPADETATSNDLGPYAADTTIQAVYTPTGGAATAGSAEIYVEFIPDNDG